jgi:hypothetical protein
MDVKGSIITPKDRSNDKARFWLVFLILLPWLLNTIHNPNNDFGLVSATVRDWVAGNTPLYAAGSVYFNYAPWSLIVYLPLSFIPHPFGQLIFNTLSLSLLIWSTWYLTKPISWKAIAISLTTIYTGMLLFLGQWDALVLASITLGWIGLQRKNPWLVGIALVGMTTKVTNVIIPLLLLLFAIRHWSFKNLLRVTIIPLGILFISFIVAGWDWPVRYSRLLKVTLAYFQQYDVMTIFSKTVYPISYRFILPPFGYLLMIFSAVVSLYLLYRLTRKGVNLQALNLSLALNLVISPYITFHHIIYLAPLQAQLLNKKRVLGLILWGCAILDLLFMWLGIGLIIYPFAALIILMIITFRELHQSETGDQSLTAS